MRRIVAFPCEDERLVGTLDEAPGRTGLLIVSGGNEIRCGAHRGMALLAQRLAARGFPVFRFDRRGIGDSNGTNGGFATSAPDIAAAATIFAAEAQIERIVAFGNCDAATALALFHASLPLDGLLLANPWVIEEADDLPPAPAICARYASMLRDRRHWARILDGGINYRKLFRGVWKILVRQPPNRRVAELIATLATTQIPVEILLATGDATAIAFAAIWRGELPVHRLDSASHSFAEPGDAAALETILVAALAR